MQPRIHRILLLTLGPCICMTCWLLGPCICLTCLLWLRRILSHAQRCRSIHSFTSGSHGSILNFPPTLLTSGHLKLEVCIEREREMCVYMYMYVYVCVCGERERERERDSESERDSLSLSLYVCTCVHIYYACIKRERESLQRTLYIAFV
jgi:hypothetical protein